MIYSKVWNFKLSTFKYFQNFQISQDCNQPVPITQSHFNNNYVVMSATEMKRFILSACLIFVDSIPIGDPFWELYILMRRITILCLKWSISRNDIDDFKELIRKHYELFLKLTGTTLEAQYHNLFYYPLVASIVVPFSQLHLRFPITRSSSIGDLSATTARGIPFISYLLLGAVMRFI